MIIPNNKDMSSTALPFVKMHGLGNDFVVVNLTDLLSVDVIRKRFEIGIDPLPELARRVCDRNYGIGADGLIVGFSLSEEHTISHEKLRQGREFLKQSGYAGPADDKCDIGWIYINGDGSSSDMCGNGLRCLALWAIEGKLVATSSFLVSTKIGPVQVDFKDQEIITVDLGVPNLTSNSIPLDSPSRDNFVKQPITAGGERFEATCVNMGNPHCVIFMEKDMGSAAGQGAGRAAEPAAERCEVRFSEAFAARAKAIQALPLFPEGVNVEFAFVDSPSRVRTYVWERGCGPTLACASGAAAVLVAGVLEQRLERKAEVVLPGGPLSVSWSQEDEHVRMTGPAEISFFGVIDLGNFKGSGDKAASSAACGAREAGRR